MNEKTSANIFKVLTNGEDVNLVLGLTSLDEQSVKVEKVDDSNVEVVADISLSPKSAFSIATRLIEVCLLLHEKNGVDIGMPIRDAEKPEEDS